MASGTFVVIDDEQPARDYLVQLLEELGYSVESFESAQHAIRYMQAKPWSWAPRLVLTDIVMDGMGGYQVIRRMEEMYPGRNIPCVVVSQLNTADYRYEAETAGATAYLNKPLDKEELQQTIEEVLTPKTL